MNEKGVSTVEFTETLLVDFLKRILAFDKNTNSIQGKTTRQIQDNEKEAKSSRMTIKQNITKEINNNLEAVKKLDNLYREDMFDFISDDILSKSDYFSRLQRCTEQLMLINAAEGSINNFNSYREKVGKNNKKPSIKLDDILLGKIDFIKKADKVNQTTGGENLAACAELYGLCRESEIILNAEITRLREVILQNMPQLQSEYNHKGNKTLSLVTRNWNQIINNIDKTIKSYDEHAKISKAESQQVTHSATASFKSDLNKLEKRFLAQYPPEEFEKEYVRLLSLEPSYNNYTNVDNIPRSIHISNLEYDFSILNISEYTKSFLNRYYPFLYRNNKISIPNCATFGSDFNYLFRFNETGHEKAVEDARALGMRLFMTLPPGKVKFTFIDPVKVGESFAMFNRLIDVDDRTSEIINGKVWSDPADIEDKLRIMTNHISNVTQRYLQGRYNNIYEYNIDAEQNAEAYEILMLMDFPAGMTDTSLKLLEQIVTTGPKCGVFTIIYRNESQFDKIPERSHPLVNNIERHLQKFKYIENSNKINFEDSVIRNNPLLWNGIKLPDRRRLDAIITTLKKGIKSADKVVIDIEKVSDAETSSSTKNGIRIPIGVRGANEVQYLTLGVGGSHHALVAGITRSGKSSLLHTIILQALSQYKSPEELEIYLVDFKRGVEFQIYADFVLPVFKVIAIETEREFGYNILSSLEKEQQRRSVLFKRAHVDKIEEYREEYEKGRQKAKVPRVLVIMDEFHELFSRGNDEISAKSAELIERIVRQGAGFGIHLILSSQSYSNVTAINKAVFDQMAVRIVLKCSKADANMLLDNGSEEIDQISIDDPGRAVYNSEAGNREYNSHFRVAYIDPSKHRGMLEDISNQTKQYANPKRPTRVLLSNIEDNHYSIFNQFDKYSPDQCKVSGRLYIGEPLIIENILNMDINRNRYANMLMIGNDDEKARSMFTFTILSLAINYWVSHGHKQPDEPFIYLLNYKPLRDSFFTDIPKALATNLLTKYVKNISIADYDVIKETIADLHDIVIGNNSISEQNDKYLMIFGYQRAEDLKSTEKENREENILSLMSSQSSGVTYSMKEMVENILTEGAQRGVHTILWQDDFKALDDVNRKLITYFYHRIAFAMPNDDFSKFVGVNDTSRIGENSAIYSNRTDDTMDFRPYQTPDIEWIESICNKLQ